MSERKYLTAVSIINGIITLIEPNGQIGVYRQRNIEKLSRTQEHNLIAIGVLNPQWRKVPVLPNNYSISFEDEEIMGKAVATFLNQKKVRLLLMTKGFGPD